MADGFKIADAYVEIHADDSAVEGEVNRSLRNARPEGESDRLGRRIGGGIGSGMVASLGGSGGGGIIGSTLGVMATKFGVATVAGAGFIAVGQQLVGLVGLLPAAGVAGGLAMGTLAVGTQGFGDAIKAVGDPAKFGEAIEKLSPQAREAAVAVQGLSPAWKSLQSSVQDSLFANTGSRISALASQYLPMLGNSMTAVGGHFNTALHDIMDMFSQAGRAADMTLVLDSSAAMIGNLTGAVAPLLSVFMDLAAVGAPMLQEMTAGAAGAATQFAAFVSTARETGQLGAWIQTGLQAFRDLWTIGSLLFGTVQNLVAALGGPSTLLGTLTLVAGALNTVSSFIRDNIAWIGPLAVAIGSVILVFKAWTIAVNLLRAAQMLLLLTNPIMLIVAAIVAGVALIIMNWDKVKAFLLALWGIIKGAALAAWNGITSAVSAAVNGARNVVMSVWNAISGFLSGMWNGVRNTASAIWNGITSVISGAVNTARSILNWFAGLPGMIGNWFNGAKNAAGNALGGLIGLVAGIPGRIMSALGNLGGMLTSSGSALISGLWDGIKSKFDWVKNKVSGMMSSLRNLFPFSPAKEGPFSGSGYTTHSGAALAGDFAKGILGQQDAVRSAVEGVMGGAQSGFGVNSPIGGPGGRAAAPAGSTSSNSVTIGALTLQVAGNLDPTNPVAWSQAIESIKDGLRDLERSFA